MKIIRVIFFSLLGLGLIACTGIFLFFQTFDADQYLPQITKKASFALGRPVSFGGMGLGFSSRGITLDAGPVTIGDDLGFTTQPFIKVDRVRISLDLRSLILHREIHITGILLQSPQIHFIRSQQGRVNVRSIGQASRSAGSDPVLVNSDGNSNGGGQGPQATGGIKPDVSFKEHALFSSIDVRSIVIQNASVSFIDQNQAFPLDIWLNGINASLIDFSLSKPFRLSFDASLLSNAPNVHASAMLFLDPSRQSVHITDLRLHTDLSHLDIDQLKDVSPEMPDSPVFKNIAGIVQLNMAHLDIGHSGDIAANGDISITGGVIKNFNLVKTILSHTLGAFGGMEDKITNLLNSQPGFNSGSEDTVIEKAQAQFSLHDKAVFIDDSLIQTNILEFTDKGSVDQGLNMDMQTVLYLNADVSAALVNELDGLKYLMDDSKRITIEASLKGVFPHLKYKPSKDFRKKSKKIWMEEGGSILGVLFK